jgi:hypothetical protein
VAVSATDTTESESELSEVAVVRYESQTENNVPRITTTDPARQVREEETYQQPIEAEDADGEALSYELARGPEGMSIGSGGMVTWDPEAGRYRIKVRVRDPNGAADSLSYGLRALSRGDATARVAFDRSTYVRPGATGQLTLTDPELDRSAGLDSQRVRIQTQAAPSGTEVLLRETEASSGRFRASFGFDPSSDGSPVVDVGPTDTLSVTYQDPYPDTTVSAEAQFFEAQPPRFAPELARPAPGAVAVFESPTLRWSGMEAPGEYRVQVATDSSFQSPREELTSDTSLVVEELEKETTYFWRVRAENVTKGPWSAPDGFETRPTQLQVSTQQSFGAAAGPEDYRLVALPGAADRPTEDVVEGQAGTEWQAWWDDGSEEDFFRKFDGSDVFAFRPGRGFWLTSVQPWSFEGAIETVSLSGSGTYEVDLHEGWNIVSNPMGQAITWAAVEALHDEDLQPLWKFDGGAFQEADTLRSASAGAGYYFLNEQGLESLTLPYPTGSTKRSKGARKSQDPKDKQPPVVSLTARQEESAATAQIGFLGGESEEPADQSLRDVVAPPGRFSRLTLRVDGGADRPARRRYLAAEYLREESQNRAIPLRLTSDRQVPVTLEVEGLSALSQRQAALMHPSQGRSYQLDERQTVRLGAVQDTARLILNVGTQAFLSQKEERVRPDGVTLSAYPNPFRKQVTLSYSLPKAQEVRLAVYDVLGREVALAGEGRREAGRHRVQFDGSSLPSGSYFVRLRVGDKTRTHKITVVR